jgi:hypothetical protein
MTGRRTALSDRLHEGAPGWLRVAAVASMIVVPGLVLAFAGDTLGYDFAAYRSAAQRVLDGQPLYDPNVAVAGGFAIFLYPPPSVVLFIPFVPMAWLPAVWLWTAILFASVVAAVALMPVAPGVRWLMLLLAGLSWPVAYSLKLGQVGPLLLLVFVVCWRAIDRQRTFGISSALGGLLKLQPFLLVAWAFATRRPVAVTAALATVVVAVLATLPIVGMQSYADYVALLSRVSDAVTTPHNAAPGAIAYQLGAPEEVARTIQLGALVLSLVVVLVAMWRSTLVGLMAVIVASQLLSPLLWDHYAIVLLVPVAFLLDRGHAWAAAIPLALSTPLVVVMPAAAVPVAFAICLVAPVLVERGRDGLGVRRPVAAAG